MVTTLIHTEGKWCSDGLWPWSQLTRTLLTLICPAWTRGGVNACNTIFIALNPLSLALTPRGQRGERIIHISPNCTEFLFLLCSPIIIHILPNKYIRADEGWVVGALLSARILQWRVEMMWISSGKGGMMAADHLYWSQTDYGEGEWPRSNAAASQNCCQGYDDESLSQR